MRHSRWVGSELLLAAYPIPIPTANIMPNANTIMIQNALLRCHALNCLGAFRSALLGEILGGFRLGCRDARELPLLLGR